MTPLDSPHKNLPIGSRSREHRILLKWLRQLSSLQLPPLPPLRFSRPPSLQARTLFRRRHWWIGASSGLLIAVLLVSQLNGDFGAWLADVSRAVLGPQRTAQIESWFLNVEDDIHQAQYHISGQKGSAPWKPSAVIPSVQGPHTPQMMPLPVMTSIVRPAAPGEGMWTTDGLPLPAAGQPHFVAKAFLHPDPLRPYAYVTLLQFDLRAVALHLVSGTTEPGGPLGHYGPGIVPVTDQQGNSLVAVFNGGFKYADGHYGLMANGVLYVPPIPGAATLGVTRQGQLILGAWGKDPRLSLADSNLVAWRQNGALLIDNGQLNPLTSDGAAWGGVYLNRAYTWRSAIGLTNHGTLIYAAGDSLSAATLGEALRAAGAVMAMQTDINPKWVRAFTYQRSATGILQIAKLNPGMQGAGNEYFQESARDFFYLTRLP